MIKILPGTWHLLYSSFPMWRKKGIADITFNYTLTKYNGKNGLIDVVRYFQDGKPKFIKGFDKPDENDPNAYKWRGKGLLMIASSKWRLEWIDPAESCIVISFEKSLFSPAGIDVLSITKSPSDKALSAALAFVNSTEPLRAKAKGMVKVRQD
jgi:hypothetical protein